METARATLFEAYLPCSTEGSTSVESENKIKTMIGGNETILVVEDETSVRELASEFLKAGGYTVLEADLLLTDMVMPRRNGRDLAGKIRKIRPHEKVREVLGATSSKLPNGSKAGGPA